VCSSDLGNYYVVIFLFIRWAAHGSELDLLVDHVGGPAEAVRWWRLAVVGKVNERAADRTWQTV